MSGMVDMAAPAKLIEPVVAAPQPQAKQYPYGLCLRLSEVELMKLGLGTPSVGDDFEFSAVACVTAVNERQDEISGHHCSVELQIQKIAVDTSAEPGEPDEKKGY